jgi:hypothetical protein
MAKKKTKATKKEAKKVWRIFRFEKRYELPEDMKIFRKSGLNFTKRFVGVGGGDEAVGYHKQFAMIENGDGIESCMFEGVYGRLVNMAAEHSRARRGFLLDADDQPLSDAQIGRLLNIKSKEMRKLLRKFASVKLIEKVELPDFDMSLNEPKGGSEDKAKDKAKDKPRNARARNSSENSGKFRKPLKKRQKSNNKNKDKKQRATDGLTAINQEENNNGKGISNNSNVQKGRRQTQPKKSPPMSAKGRHPPTTAPMPSVPQRSDEGGSKVIPFVPPGSACFSRAAKIYGRRIYLALELPWDLQSHEAKREIGSFAALHDRALLKLAQAGMQRLTLENLLHRGLAEAEKIASRKRKARKPGEKIASRKQKARKPGAVWNDLFDKLIKARLREAM